MGVGSDGGIGYCLWYVVVVGIGVGGNVLVLLGVGGVVYIWCGEKIVVYYVVVWVCYVWVCFWFGGCNWCGNGVGSVVGESVWFFVGVRLVIVDCFVV